MSGAPFENLLKSLSCLEKGLSKESTLVKSWNKSLETGLENGLPAFAGDANISLTSGLVKRSSFTGESLEKRLAALVGAW